MKKTQQTLKRRLDVVRTRIRDLSPDDLAEVNGGYMAFYCECPQYSVRTSQ